MTLLFSYIRSKRSKCTIPIARFLKLRGVHRASGMMSIEEEATSCTLAGTSVRPTELPSTTLSYRFRASQARPEVGIIGKDWRSSTKPANSIHDAVLALVPGRSTWVDISSLNLADLMDKHVIIQRGRLYFDDQFPGNACWRISRKISP